MGLDDLSLPRREDDRPLVLGARAHLREEVRPVLGAGADVDPTFDPIAPNGGTHNREAEDHRACAFFDDVGIGPVERYA
jgi:hypothetical protein